MEPFGCSPMLYHVLNAMYWLSLFEIVYLPQMILNVLWYLLMAMWIMSMLLTDALNYQHLNLTNFPFVFQILMHFSLVLVLLVLLLLFVLIHCFQYHCYNCFYLVFVSVTITNSLNQCFHFLLLYLLLAVPILNYKYENWPWILMEKAYLFCIVVFKWYTNLILNIIKMWFHFEIFIANI